MWKVAAIGTGALVVQACAPSIRPVETVLADVRRDEVAAASTMRGRDVGLEGRVNQKGVKTEQAFVLKYWGAGEANAVQRGVGYLELGSTTGAQSGHALCLFEPEAFDWLASVKVGQVVKIACEFVTVEGDRSDRYPVFHTCWVQH
jgi:hypothetical protein